MRAVKVLMSHRIFSQSDHSLSVHQSCGKLSLCGLDRPDTEAGGALLLMLFVAILECGRDRLGGSWKRHDISGFHQMLTDAMRPPCATLAWRRLGGWGDPREGFIYSLYAANGTPRAALEATSFFPLSMYTSTVLGAHLASSSVICPVIVSGIFEISFLVDEADLKSRPSALPV